MLTRLRPAAGWLVTVMSFLRTLGGAQTQAMTGQAAKSSPQQAPPPDCPDQRSVTAKSLFQIACVESPPTG